MLFIETKFFGQVEIDPEQVIQFDVGIPGFESFRHYILLQEEDSLFSFLESIDEAGLAFIVVNPFIFYPQYEFRLPEDVVQSLEIQSDQEVEVWGMVSVSEDIREATINLLAPLVINRRNKQGRQVVLHNTSYTTKHKLISDSSEAGKKEGESHARA